MLCSYPVNIHDSYVWVDSAFSGEHFKDLLGIARFENRIHEKGSRTHPLAAVATERNSIRPQIRALIEQYLVVLPHQWEVNLQENLRL